MSDNIELSSFPDNATAALAMLYVKNQDIKGLTPEELQTLYYETYYALLRDYRDKRLSGWIRDQKERG